MTRAACLIRAQPPALRRTCAFLALALALAPAAAQTLADKAVALAEARRQAAAAQGRARALEAEAGRAADAAARARAQAAAVAGRILAAEADVATATARIRLVEGLRARQRARLAARQEPVVKLAAGLQTMARRPSALAVVQRGSIADLVHVRAVLAGQLPLVRARTATLRREVAEGVRLQKQADGAVAMLRAGQRRLHQERLRYAALERSHDSRAQRLVDRAMEEEDRAMALGEEARDIVEQMGRLGQRATRSARLVALAGPTLRPPIPGHSAAAVPDADGLPYRLPVAGRLLAGLGEVSDSGVRARGLTLAVSPGSRVTAPAAGRIAYAGPFQGYGRVVIIHHPGGWTTLVTDMAALDVGAGDAVVAGSPLGQAAAARGGLTVELRRNGRPVDIIPLLARG